MNRKITAAATLVSTAAIAAACGLNGEGLAPSLDGGRKDAAASKGEGGAYDPDASGEAGDTEASAGDGTARDALGSGDGPSDSGSGAGDADGAGDGDHTSTADGGDATADGPGSTDGGGGLDSSGDARADVAGPTDAAADRPDASAPDGSGGDASPDGSGACDFNGTWASRLTIDVSWAPQGLTGIILAPGSGQIRQWIKGVRVQNGMSTTDATVVCGVELPDFQSTALASSETYGAVFPNSLFDNRDGGSGYLPIFTVSAALSGLTPGSTYSTTTTAALLGLTMTNPTTDAWPSTVTTQVDMDQDTEPGVTLDVPTGTQSNGVTYSGVPVGLPALFQAPVRASRLYVAIRQVTVVTGTVQDCSHMTGTIAIPQISGKAGIDSHVLGCALAAGGDCSSTQASFVDNTQPVFTPSGTTDFHSVRLATGATCAEVRAALP